MVLAVPFVDLALAVVRRTRAGRSPFSPDKQHLHHRLLEIGHSHLRAVLLMWMWAALLGFGGVVASFSDSPVPVLVGVVVLTLLSLVLVRAPRRSGGRPEVPPPQADAQAQTQPQDAAVAPGAPTVPLAIARPPIPPPSERPAVPARGSG